MKYKLCRLNCHFWEPMIHAGHKIRGLFRCKNCFLVKMQIIARFPSGIEVTKTVEEFNPYHN